MLNTQGRVLNTRKPRQDSLGNSVDSNVRVTVAVENKYGIDGHRHPPLPEGGCPPPPSASSYGMDVPDHSPSMGRFSAGLPYLTAHMKWQAFEM